MYNLTVPKTMLVKWHLWHLLWSMLISSIRFYLFGGYNWVHVIVWIRNIRFLDWRNTVTWIFPLEVMSTAFQRVSRYIWGDGESKIMESCYINVLDRIQIMITLFGSLETKENNKLDFFFYFIILFIINYNNYKIIIIIIFKDTSLYKQYKFEQVQTYITCQLSHT